MKLGCCTKTDNYHSAEILGYDFVEFSATQIHGLSDDAFEKLLKTLQNGRIPCFRFNDYCTGETPLVGPKVDFGNLEAYAEKVCSRAGRLGAKSLGIGAPKARILPENFSLEQADMQMKQFLTMLCQKAQTKGIYVLMEAVHDGLCNYINKTQEAVGLVKSLDIPNLKIVLDFYHSQVMGESIESFCDVSEWVDHVHVSSRDAGNRRAYLLKSDEAEFGRICDTLKRCGYDGSISVEAPTHDFYEEARVCLDVMKRGCISV